MLRAASKPAKRKYAEKMFSSFTLADVTTPAGIMPGTVPAFTVDRPRFERAVRRYVRGLYKYDTNIRLASKLHVEVVSDPNAVNRSRDAIMPVLQGATVQVVQEGVFWYAWRRASDNPDAMVWLLVFFDAFPIFCVINRRDRFGNVAA